MTYHSGWYAHEYQITEGGEFVAGAAGYYEVGPFNDDAGTYYNQGAINEAMAGAVVDVPGVGYGYDSFSLAYQVHLDRHQRDFPFGFDRTYRASAGTSAITVYARNASTGDWAPEFPEGAIGFEFEPVHPTVLGASARIEADMYVLDRTVDPWSTPDGEAWLQIRVLNRGEWTDVPGGREWVGWDGTISGDVLGEEFPIYRPPNTPDVSTVLVTPYLQGDRGELALSASIRQGFGPVPTNPYADADLVGQGGVRIEVDYALMRRYRFIFPGEPPAEAIAPPCRLFPREDGLGVGGGRVFPPTKSQQRSNRWVGYY